MADDRMPSTGMKVTEAIGRASTWWDLKGRFVMAKEFNRVQKAPKNGRGFVIRGEFVDGVPSGIMRGMEWALLSMREQANIVKMWHHFFVVMKDVENPDISAEDRDMMRRLQIQ